MLKTILYFPFKLVQPFCCWVAWTLIKMWQFPQILGEILEPKYLSDTVCSPAKNGGVFCIFTVYGRWGFSQDLADLFSIFSEESVNVIAVVNGAINDEEMSRLKSAAHRVIHRPNVGRDFGGYRSATLKLYAEEMEVERVIYMNDSNYYIHGDELRNLVRKLSECGHYDIIGATENQKIHHIGSFAVSISKNLFHGENLKKFWRLYRPYNLRPHAIHAGEMKLSKLLKKKSDKIQIVYSLDKLSEVLFKISHQECVESVQLLPQMLKDKGFKIKKLIKASNTAKNMMRAIEKYKKHAEVKNYGGSMDSAEKFAVFGIGETLLNLYRADLISFIIKGFSASSQIHLAFGYFHKYLQFPLVKKDLFYRGLFFEEQFPLILSDLKEEERLHIIRMQLNRGCIQWASTLSISTRIYDYLRLL